MATQARAIRKILLSIIVLVVISRGLMLFTGYIGLNLFSKYSTVTSYEQNAPGSLSEWKLKLPGDLAATQQHVLGDFIKFDSYSYLKIATHGYDKVRMDEPHTAANWVFFPLYPLLIFLVGKVLLLEPAMIGIILSNLLLIAALVYIYLVCLQKGLTEKQAWTAIFMILIYPSSLYFSVPYTESLFLLLSAASLYYASDKKYAVAFLAAGLSTVTRVPGFINLAFVLGSVLLDEGFRFSRNYVKYSLYFLMSLVPMGLYLLHMKSLTGDLLAPFHEQSLNWFRYTSIPFKNVLYYIHRPYFSTPDGWDNGFIAFAVTVAVLIIFIGYFLVHIKAMFRDLKQLLFYVYGAMLIIIPFSSQPYFLVSVVRYMMVCIPFYIYLIKLTEKSDNAQRFYQIFFLMLHVIITIGFFNDYYFVI